MARGQAAERLVQRGIGRLDVEKNHVGVIEKRREAIGVRRGEGGGGGVQAGVDAACGRGVGGAEEGSHEVGLRHGLAARHGDAAALVEGAVALVALEQLANAHTGAGAGAVRAGELPGVGVVAVLAAHGAPLAEHHEPRTGAVHRPKALGGVHPPDHVNVASMTLGIYSHSRPFHPDTYYNHDRANGPGICEAKFLSAERVALCGAIARAVSLTGQVDLTSPRGRYG